MVGLITVDDVIDVIHEEATEDIYNLAGLDEEERVFSPVGLSVRKRLPWMVVNLAPHSSRRPWSALPAHHRAGRAARSLHARRRGHGGQRGVQALTVVTRGLALGETSSRAGCARSASSSWWNRRRCGHRLPRRRRRYYWNGSPIFGLVVFTAMLASMAVAGLAGAAVRWC